MEKSNLKTNKNPTYRYAPKADFEYLKKVKEIRKKQPKWQKNFQKFHRISKIFLILTWCDNFPLTADAVYPTTATGEMAGPKNFANS